MGSCGPMESLSRWRFHAQIPEPEAALPGSRHLSQRRLPKNGLPAFGFRLPASESGSESRAPEADAGPRTRVWNRHADFSKV